MIKKTKIQHSSEARLKKQKNNKNKNTLLLVKITAEEVAALATSRQQREL